MTKYGAVFILSPLLAGSAGLFEPGFLQAAIQVSAGEDEAVALDTLAIPPGYRYAAAGRRDPFVNPVPPTTNVQTAPVIAPNAGRQGLSGILLNEAQVVGVVSSPEGGMNVVLIRGPGNRTFVARPGDELLDVVISGVRSDSVVFEVKPVEGAREPVEREEVVRPLSAASGG